MFCILFQSEKEEPEGPQKSRKAPFISPGFVSSFILREHWLFLYHSQSFNCRENYYNVKKQTFCSLSFSSNTAYHVNLQLCLGIK